MKERGYLNEKSSLNKRPDNLQGILRVFKESWHQEPLWNAGAVHVELGAIQKLFSCFDVRSLALEVLGIRWASQISEILSISSPRCQWSIQDTCLLVAPILPQQILPRYVFWQTSVVFILIGRNFFLRSPETAIYVPMLIGSVLTFSDIKISNHKRFRINDSQQQAVDISTIFTAKMYICKPEIE